MNRCNAKLRILLKHVSNHLSVFFHVSNHSSIIYQSFISVSYKMNKDIIRPQDFAVASEIVSVFHTLFVKIMDKWVHGRKSDIK